MSPFYYYIKLCNIKHFSLEKFNVILANMIALNCDFIDNYLILLFNHIFTDIFCKKKGGALTLKKLINIH